MYTDLAYIPLELATKVNQWLSKYGLLPDGRILLLTPNEFKQKSGQIIIPGTVKDKPKKGIVVQVGYIDESHHNLQFLKVGMKVTYGLYAGKELEINPDVIPEDLKKVFEQNTSTVLDIHEISYVELNLQ